MFARLCWAALVCAGGLRAADESVEKTIRDLYASSQAAVWDARSAADLRKAMDSFAPEWVGNMPAGETITLDFLLKEGESLLAIAPEKRPPLPQIDFMYIRETGWNVLVVYWNSRRMGGRVIGSLYRDTWVRAVNGWKRIRTEKMFPDRPLVEDGKPMILPAGN